MATAVLNTKVGVVENKVLDDSSLVTAAVLNTKISEVENKILTMINKLLLKNLIS